jgi:pimeloyl-ACP methyl ester carboxylesterase
MSRCEFERDGIRLAYHDLGGSGPAVLLLHGLAGYAGEWSSSAEFLIGDHRVFALDQRGHGESERTPEDVTRLAYVEDCAAAIRQIDLGSVTLVGQSMGANTAMLTAAAHPDLVHGLVMIEGSPAGPEPSIPAVEAAQHFSASLSAWPVPFTDEDAAADFFTAKGFDPGAWTGGLEHRGDGLWPRWDVATLADTMGALACRSYWPQWRSIRCPTLVVFGERGLFPADHGEALIEELATASVVTIPGAGHDVHLDAPQLWVRSLTRSEIP